LQGFFEGAMANRSKKGAVAAAFVAEEDLDVGAEPEGWGDDADLDLDDEEKQNRAADSADEEGGMFLAKVNFKDGKIICF
jgi:Coatomer (COPI) alpha subunit C-terminus